MGLPDGSGDKKSAFNAGDLASTPGLGRCPGEGNGKPLQYSCLEKYYGQRSLVGYSPWGRKELDTTKRLTHTQRVGDQLQCPSMDRNSVSITLEVKVGQQDLEDGRRDIKKRKGRGTKGRR